MQDKKIVLLIDAENTSAKFADGIMKYLTEQGDIISAQIYGDFIDNHNTPRSIFHECDFTFLIVFSF